jgi:hypothetical protein
LKKEVLSSFPLLLLIKGTRAEKKSAATRAERVIKSPLSLSYEVFSSQTSLKSFFEFIRNVLRQML